MLRLSQTLILCKLPSIISTLLQQYEVFFFQKPQLLPPVRSRTHQIHLYPGAKHVNVRPYRYPISKK